jgi:hypothetical protein
MIADLLTKALPAPRTKILAQNLSIYEAWGGVLGQNQVQSSYFLKTDIYAHLLNQEKSRKTFIKTYNS